MHIKNTEVIDMELYFQHYLVCSSYNTTEEKISDKSFSKTNELVEFYPGL